MLRVREKVLAVLSLALARSHVALHGRVTTQTTCLCDVDDIIEQHFDAISDVDHASRATMSKALRSLAGRPAYIIETGTAAWGTQSTLLFFSYVRRFGGQVITIDTRVQPALKTLTLTSKSVKYLVGDSLKVLNRKRVKAFLRSADLIYLDSWDVDLNEPEPSARHGLQEFLAVSPYLKSGALILIDDTPRDQAVWGVQTEAMRKFEGAWGVPIGKGAFILKFLKGSRLYGVLMHEYQVLFVRH
jgi:hypothetical protein